MIDRQESLTQVVQGQLSLLRVVQGSLGQEEQLGDSVEALEVHLVQTRCRVVQQITRNMGEIGMLHLSSAFTKERNTIS